MNSHTNVKETIQLGSFSWFHLKNRCNKARLLVISNRYITRITRLVPVRFSSNSHRWSTPSSLSAGPLPLVRWTEAESSRLPPVRSTISSWSYRSSSEPVVVAEWVEWCEPDDSWLVRENEPRRGGANVRWLAGLTVMIKLELFATIISVTCTTYSELHLPNTCIITT